MQVGLPKASSRPSTRTSTHITRASPLTRLAPGSTRPTRRHFIGQLWNMTVWARHGRAQPRSGKGLMSLWSQVHPPAFQRLVSSMKNTHSNVPTENYPTDQLHLFVSFRPRWLAVMKRELCRFDVYFFLDEFDRIWKDEAEYSK